MNESWFAFKDRNVQFEPVDGKWYGLGKPFKRRGQAINYVWKEYKKLKNIPDRYL